MRRSRQEITDNNEIQDIIMRAHTARLAINREGFPYIVPMNFGYSGGVFYFHCATEGLKLDLLRSDPRVCIEIDEEGGLNAENPNKPCSWGFTYRSIIAGGTAEFIEDLDEKTTALNLIISHFRDQKLPEGSEEAVRSVTVFRVKPDNLTAKGSD